MARAQDGDIQVFSTLNQGSCFVLDIPLVRACDTVSQTAGDRPDALPASREALASLEGVRALLVEDNEVNRLFVRKVLEQVGMRVTEAEHGREACAVFNDAGGAYDLVVLDTVSYTHLRAHET